MNFSKNASKPEKHSLTVRGSLWGEKQFILIFVPFYWFDQKQLFKQIQTFLRFCHFSDFLRKKKVLSISEFLSEIVNFWLKREIFREFPQKCFKTTEKHSLTVRGSIWGEKQFMLVFVPIYWFDQKQLFKQIQTFIRICHFSDFLRKTNFQSISELLSEIVTFFDKKEKFSWNFPQNASKQQKCIV